MTKLGYRFSFSLASAMFILLLCFAPSALGQSTAGGRTGSDSVVLSQALPALLALSPAADLLQTDRRDRDNKNNNNNKGCTAQDKGRDKRSNCTAVPEGGTALAYLSLVALGCLATGIFRNRQQARLRETK